VLFPLLIFLSKGDEGFAFGTIAFDVDFTILLEGMTVFLWIKDSDFQKVNNQIIFIL
jgi:hypothetical protein